jgi:uncharacterized protein YwbE
MSFKPFDLMSNRLESYKNDSDLAYFYELLILGELLTKTINLFLVASINDDNDRTRYRQEYSLVRANAIGDFVKSIDEILTGPPAQLLASEIRDFELKELVQRSSPGEWQYEAQKLLSDTLSVFAIEHTTMATKSPLRNWFNNFAHLRNKTKGHGATTIEPCSKACPLLERSIQLIINNFTAFKRPWAYLHRNYSGKYRISYLTEKTTDFDFLKHEIYHSMNDGVYCYLDKPRIINLMFSNPELTDFYHTNGNLRNDSFESISYLSDERLSCSAKEYLLPITQLPSSHTEGSSELEVIGNCFTNLPESIDEYVKRPILESELIKVLNETERFPIITLLGKGGVGKTSLALNVIKGLTVNDRFDLIIWFSARDIDLLMDGPKQVQTKVLNQKDIASEYCKLVHPNQDIKDKLEFFSKELTKNTHGKALYIFDNFETVTNPIEVFEWINTYVRNPNKVLITSRISRNFKADYPIEIQGMNESECKSLIEIVSSKLNISSLLTPNYIDELITESDGHPYIIKILLGEVSKSGKIGKVQRIVAEQEKILTALFKRTFNTLSPAAKRVFLTLSSWNSLVPVIAVEAVLWRPENEKIDIQGAIEELRKSSFIDIINEDKEALINVPLAASIFGKGELEVYPEKIKIYDDRKLLMEFGASTNNTISVGLTSKIERKFSEVAKRINSLEEFRNELPTLEYVASRFPKAYEYLVDIFEEFSDYVSVKYYLREYLKTSLPLTEKARLWLKLADICKLTKDWDGESHSLSELVLLPNVEFNSISEASNRINYYFRFHPEAKSVEYKKLLLDKVIEIMSRRIKEGNATDYSRLAWLLINNNQDEKAKETIERGLSIDSDNLHCQRLYAKINNR